MLGSNRLVLYRPPWESKPKAKASTPMDEQELLRQFIARVGGIENARQALAMLALLRGQGETDTQSGPAAAA